MTLLDAVREVMSEIRAKHGAEVFPYVSAIDVADELRAFYGAPRA